MCNNQWFCIRICSSYHLHQLSVRPDWHTDSPTAENSYISLSLDDNMKYLNRNQPKLNTHSETIARSNMTIQSQEIDPYNAHNSEMNCEVAYKNKLLHIRKIMYKLEYRRRKHCVLCTLLVALRRKIRYGYLIQSVYIISHAIANAKRTSCNSFRI